MTADLVSLDRVQPGPVRVPRHGPVIGPVAGAGPETVRAGDGFRAGPAEVAGVVDRIFQP